MCYSNITRMRFDDMSTHLDSTNQLLGMGSQTLILVLHINIPEVNHWKMHAFANEVYVCMYACTYACMHARMYGRMCVCMHVLMHARIRVAVCLHVPNQLMSQ